MIVNPAGAVIDQVRRYNQDYCKRKQPELVVVPELFCEKQKYAKGKYQQGNDTVMMLSVAMPE